jgi:hypothetical protein
VLNCEILQDLTLAPDDNQLTDRLFIRVRQKSLSQFLHDQLWLEAFRRRVKHSESGSSVDRKQICHADRSQLTVLKSIGVPLLRGLDGPMTQKITHFEDSRTHFEQSRTGVSSQLVPQSPWFLCS